MWSTGKDYSYLLDIEGTGEGVVDVADVDDVDGLDDWVGVDDWADVDGLDDWVGVDDWVYVGDVGGIREITLL